MADTRIVYDRDGNPALPRNSRGGYDFHRYQESMGKCVCGKDRWHPEHFNGDGAAAKLAMDADRKRRGDHTDWVAKMREGSPVMVSDDHPTTSMRGMIGTVVEVSRDLATGKTTVGVKFPDRTVHVVAKWLTQPPLPEPPPRFASQEEADQWLEDTAKEMGIRTEPVVPRFSSPDEADEWMRRQQGEPYIPPSWQPDGSLDPGTWSDQQIVELLQKSIKPGEPIVTSSLTRAGLKQAIKGAQMKGVYLDEAIDTSATTADDVIDPYA